MIGGSILCIGDSLTYGSRHDYDRSYPLRLGEILSERYGQNWVGITKGNPGWTSSQLVREEVYDWIIGYDEASEVVAWMGTNDAKVGVETPEPVYELNLMNVIRTCRLAGKKLFLLNLPGQHGFGAPDFIKEDLIGQYNEVIERVVDADNDVFLVDVASRVRDNSLYSDGIHLNASGYEAVARTVADKITEIRT